MSVRVGRPADPAVRVIQLARTYGSGPQAVTALAGVDAEFHRGTFTAVMGPSGSGKSTLLQTAAGLDRPSSGQVWIGGQDLSRLSETKLTKLRRSRIGFVFQAFNLIGALTVEENIHLPLRLSGVRPDAAWLRQVVERVGLGDRLHHRPAELSGGQQQRVAIARALAMRPEVIFCDEPTGALDTQTAADVLALLRSVVDDAQQTVIMVTHDPVAASYADRVMVLADGRIVRDMPQPGAEQIAEQLAWLGRRQLVTQES
ncbi:ABC transporter ATP-binding protein [Verrucosispora sp. WMMA2044]|uniref:ABC transporter ATP-binding protein n=1 Tax=Verrucosispora sioxanthis TaxID=2499994 RepID=A0A6M1LCI1_9ACTN|nr:MULTISPECIES: ABC transporter ATP-binding protein [Micromonospora]NEE66714.1 ABC transporter ATP-binding protein [Verrucosispora sioxanthis]NGM15824.1 ABC transporter ATP-binding protein [Verrucosispora sioxanthis]WBB48558.1 ABC transporter ATP-binding protein [Verrucosispora sp. WMMA2044]WFE47773.1 ABC transporter ATP-binding protein [Verrucosispora sp. WMMD1129]